MKGRRLELLVLACGAIFVVILALSFRPGRRPRPSAERAKTSPAPGSETAGQPTTLLDGFDFTESVGGKPLLRIKADETVGYGPGAGLAPDLYSGKKVTLTVYPDDGAPVTVYSDRADYDERTRESRLQGNVRWTDLDGSLAETADARFHPGSKTLEAPGKVHFTKGSIDLTAPSARYDLRDRTVKFSGPIEGSGSGQESGGLSKLTAREGLFRRDQSVLELEFPDGQSKAGDRFAADHMVLKMAPSGGSRHPEWARSTGNVHGILAAEGAAAPAAGVAAGPRRDRQYAGDESMVSFGPDGKPVKLTLTGAPAVLSEPGRRLTAKQIDLAFTDGKVISARASGGVRVDSEQGRAEADSASLGIGKEGDPENVTLDGHVRIDDQGRKAQASRAVEVKTGGTWILTGDSSQSARVESGGSRMSADRIELDREHNRIRGEGRARAVFSPDPQKKDPTAIFVGDPKRPSYARADRISVDDTTHLVVLSGSASLWQDTSSLFADDITLSDAEKSVTAVNAVRAVMSPVKDKDHPASTDDKGPSVILAKHLLYRDTDRSARFEGGVTMTRGGMRATGGESTAWISKEKDRGVDCVETSGDVHMVDRTVGRTATAEKAVDYPKLGKTMLWGSPARVTDASGNQVAGAILTMTDRGRSVEITAPEGGKTETIHRTQKN